jgi:K+-transporting ATPase ATPase A chain
MTFKCAYEVSTLEPGAMGTGDNGQPKQQTIVTGPVAATVPMEQLGTNGGGFFGMNFAHPYQSPTAVTNFFACFAMMVFPFSLVLMYGRMLKRIRHSVIIFSVMLLLFIGTIVWTIYFDTLKPNPGLTVHPQGRTYSLPSATAPGGKREVAIAAIAGLPVDQHLGNLEGKELRFGTSAGATWGAITTDVTCGAINSEQDSLNPLAGLSPMVGMWLNCIFGGKGVGVINMLLFLITGVFIAGQMVGRTPEYLGKKIGGREMKLAMIALLVHPIMILFPTGYFSASDWGTKAISNPGAHGFSQIMYQFSSASANNGSAFDGLGTTGGTISNPKPLPNVRSLGHRDGSGHDIQPVPANCSAYRNGSESGCKEIFSVWLGNFARRHRDVRLSTFRHNCNHRCPAVPARSRARAGGRASWSYPVWWLTPLRRRTCDGNCIKTV